MLKNQKGQIIIVILLLMAVALTVGLSISSQTASDIKISSQLEESERAYSAAEAGIESALSTSQPGTATLSNESTYAVTINKFEDGHTVFFFPKKVAQDDTKQIWLVAHTDEGDLDEANDYEGSSLTIYWGDSAEVADPKPAVEATLVFKDIDYDIKKYTFDPESGRRLNNNFGEAETGPYNVADKTLQYKGSISDLDSVCPTATCTRYALRIRLLYNSSLEPLAVKPDDDKTLYSQGKQIDSVGQSGAITRKVVVFESHPALPGIFDYVLFSGTNLTKE